MATLHASTEIDVPLEFANLEWSEFALEALFTSYTRGFADVEPLLDEQDMNAGKVEFTTSGDRLVKVDVAVEYTPRTVGTADDEVARAQATLEHDLEKYRLFVLDQCERRGCRAA